MAGQSPREDEAAQNESISSLEEQHDDSLSHSVNALSLGCKCTGGGQSTFTEDCGHNNRLSDDETPLKSYRVMDRDRAVDPPEPGELNKFLKMRNKGTTFNQRQGQPVISLDVHPRQSGFDHSPSSNRTMTEAQPVPQLAYTSNNTMQSSSSQMPPSLSSSSWSDRPSHGLPMNIPPSLPEPRINNTNIPVAYAEQQPSFRTTSTVSSPLSPITRGAEGQLPHQDQMYNGVYQSNSFPGMFSSVFSEDNSQNISVSPWLGHPPMTARPMCTNSQMGLANGNVRGQASGGPGDYGRQISHSNSTSSMKSFINDDSPVRKLSHKILSHIALTLQCRHTSASWKDLVEKYGWDYDRTYLFENKPHPGYIFLSLLQEPEFQEYSLEQLRQDLFDLPRKDILTDLNKMINDHNTVASGRTAQNQLT